MKINYGYCALKTSALIPLFFLLPLIYALPCMVFVVWAYQYVIAAIMNVNVMPTSDYGCFFGDDTARVNFMSATILENYPFEKAKANFAKLMEKLPKTKYRIVKVLGDYYYKELPLQEAIDYTFRRVPDGVVLNSDEDINKFVENNLNLEMPLNKPQWTIWWQDKFQDENHSISIWKSHHSFCDGLSVMSLHLAMGDTYDSSALIPIKKIPFI